MTDRERPKPPRPISRDEVEARRKLEQRQSDHEIKVSDELKAIAKYAKEREAVDRDLAIGLAVCARELGAADRMPATIQEHARALEAAEPKRNAVHEDAKTSARGARATYLVLAISVVELLREIAPLFRHLFGAQ